MKNTKITETRNVLLILAAALVSLYVLKLFYPIGYDLDNGMFLFYAGFTSYIATLELIRIYKGHSRDEGVTRTPGMLILIFTFCITSSQSHLLAFIYHQPYGSDSAPRYAELAWELKNHINGGIGLLALFALLTYTAAGIGAFTNHQSQWLYSFSKKCLLGFGGLYVFAILIKDVRYELATLYNNEWVSAAAVLGYILLTVTLAATITSKKLRKVAL